MATNFKTVEPAFRTGCGRYLQESGALARLPEEVRRLNARHALILADTTTQALAGEKAQSLLRDAGIAADTVIYDLFCNQEEARRLAASETFAACDIVIGVGGGNILDYAKLCAVLGGRPVICVATSSATCAAYSPLSVVYNDQFQTVGTIHHPVEVNAVLVDMDILCRQPSRLLVAGAYDAMAKMIETAQRLKGREEADIHIGVRAAFELSKFTYQRLLDDLPQARRDTERGVNSKAVYDVVFNAIATTGLISAMARGSNQTAIAHKVYEGSRKLFPQAVRYRLHGELVAVGLLAQLIFNGQEDQVEGFRRRMREDGLPCTLSEAGLPKEETVERLHAYMLTSSAMAGTGKEEQALLRRALQKIL